LVTSENAAAYSIAQELWMMPETLFDGAVDGITNDLRARLTCDIGVVVVLLVIVLSSVLLLFLPVVQLAGGRGSESGDGDSKHLLAAKYEVVGDPLRLRRELLLLLK
jgi:hypothetical protein